MKKPVITDMGQTTTLKSDDGSEITIERYGVWMSGGYGKQQVVEVSNDLPMLLEKYDLNSDDVVALKQASK